LITWPRLSKVSMITRRGGLDSCPFGFGPLDFCPPPVAPNIDRTIKTPTNAQNATSGVM